MLDIAKLTKKDGVFRKHFWIPSILALTIAIALGYSFYFSREMDFWDSIIATALSLIAGIPIALWISGLLKSKEEKERFASDRQKEKETLKFILKELSFDEDRIKEGRVISETSFHPLQTEVWEVLKVSGQLNLIQDPEVLNRITSAYDITMKIAHFEEKALDDWNLGNKVLDLASVWAIQLKRARTFDSLLLASITEAKASIKVHLQNIDPR